MANLRGYIFGTCKHCKDDLYTHPETGLCVLCELDYLRDKVEELQICLDRCQKEKAAALHHLSDARIKIVGVNL